MVCDVGGDGICVASNELESGHARHGRRRNAIVRSGSSMRGTAGAGMRLCGADQVCAARQAQECDRAERIKYVLMKEVADKGK